MNLLLLLLSAPQAAEPEFRSVKEVLDHFADEPDVRAVQQMVLEYSKTDPRYVDAWLSASKNAALLPELTLTYDYGDDLNYDYEYIASVEDLAESSVDIDNAVEVKAKWRLDKLVMSSERIRMISETQDIVKLRDKVLEAVTRLYFDRRRLQVEMLMSGGDLKAQLKNQLRLQELTAQLDAYTGGRFSAEVERKP